MEEKTMINVLWIDDIKFPGILTLADRNNINLDWYDTLDAGMEKLKKNFNRFHAVIFDCYGKIHDALESEDEEFLREAVNQLNEICREKKTKIPWYVLSNGHKDNFSVVTKMVIDSERRDFEQEWGKPVYIKVNNKDTDELFCNIKRAASNQDSYRIFAIYKSTFNAMHRDYWNPEARKSLFSILENLHFPEKNTTFNPLLYYNQLRHIIEYLFRAANNDRLKILPDDFLPEGNVNLTESYRFLSGVWAPIIGMRYGEKNEYVFPPYIASFINEILSVGNVQSHSTKLSPDDERKLDEYFHQWDSKLLLFSYALRLCDVISFWGEFVSKHTDIEENKKKYKSIHPEEYNEKVVPVQWDNNIKCLYYKECCLENKTKKRLENGTKVKLFDCKRNSYDSSKTTYPILANFKIVD